MMNAKDRAIKEARSQIVEAYFRLDEYKHDPVVQQIREGLKLADRHATAYLNNLAMERMADNA